MPQTPSESGSAPYQIFMLALCIYALLMLGTEVILKPSQDVSQILSYTDAAICLIFFVDFVIAFARAPNRARYFFTWGWIDLISSIPMIEPLRLGRAARVLRIIRVLRSLRSAKVLAEFIVANRAQSAFLAAALFSILVVSAASIAILYAEGGEGGRISSPEDAFWWSLVTITTVGYGDVVPGTTLGRVIAGFLMAIGVGLFGTFTGFVATWFLAPGEEAQDRELEAVRRELTSIRESLARLEQQTGIDSPQSEKELT